MVHTFTPWYLAAAALSPTPAAPLESSMFGRLTLAVSALVVATPALAAGPTSPAPGVLPLMLLGAAVFAVTSR